MPFRFLTKISPNVKYKIENNLENLVSKDLTKLIITLLFFHFRRILRTGVPFYPLCPVLPFVSRFTQFTVRKLLTKRASAVQGYLP